MVITPQHSPGGDAGHRPAPRDGHHPPTARDVHRARAAGEFAQLSGGLRIVIGAALLALLLRTTVLEPFNVPSESMLPTLVAGDYLLVAKWPYGFSRFSPPFPWPLIDRRIGGGPPRRGDVVVFKTPRDNRTDFIKRIIGLPGDRVRMTGGQIELNGVLVPKIPAGSVVDQADGLVCHDGSKIIGGGCTYPRFVEMLGDRRYAVADEVSGDPRDDTPLVTVPAGHYFVAGDNRDDSADSRLSIADGGVGMVPAVNIVGRAEVVFFSIGTHGIRWARIGTCL